MKRRIMFFCLPMLVFLLTIQLFPAHADSSDPVTMQIAGRKNYIFYQPHGSYGSISDYDATDEYIFFSYSEKQSVVKAYDMEGQYAFSIRLENADKGVVYIRCEDNLLFTHSKNGDIFVFSSDQLVQHIPADKAKELGYSYRWFIEKIRHVKLDGLSLYLLDKDGNKASSIPIPFSVIAEIYAKHSLLIAIVIVLIVSCFRRKRPQEHRL